MATLTAAPVLIVPERFRLGLELEIWSDDVVVVDVPLGFCVLISVHQVLSCDEFEGSPRSSRGRHPFIEAGTRATEI
jgi:hypothetical protein